MNYEQKYLKYKMKYLNLLSNQKGGKIVLNCKPLEINDIIIYNKQEYTYIGEEQHKVEAKGEIPEHFITRIILFNKQNYIYLPFEKNKIFLTKKA